MPLSEAAMVATLHQVLTNIPHDMLPSSTLSLCEASTVLAYRGITAADAEADPPLVPVGSGGRFFHAGGLTSMPRPRKLKMVPKGAAAPTHAAPNEVHVVSALPDGHCLFRSVSYAKPMFDIFLRYDGAHYDLLLVG